MINNGKGKAFIDSMTCFDIRQYSVEDAVYNNKRAWPQIKPAKRPDQTIRDRFVHNLNKRPFVYTIDKYILPENNIIRKVYKFIKLHFKDAFE